MISYSTSAGSNIHEVPALAPATGATVAVSIAPATVGASTTATATAATATAATAFLDVGEMYTSPAAVMSGSSSVLSGQQLIDVDFATKKVKDSNGNWPFSNSWYHPASGPKLSQVNSRDPTKYLSIPVLLFMPVNEFPLRFDRRPCAAFGYQHKRVVSK